MRPIQRVITLSGKEYYTRHLEIVSCLVPTKLTDKEIEVLASFLALDKKITEKDMFNTMARKEVRESLGLSPGGLGNHLKSMIGKKVLDKDEMSNRITIKEFLLPAERQQGYQIKIIKINKL